MLRVREKVHTREGGAIAAARRRAPPLVEVDGATLIGERGAVTAPIVIETIKQVRAILEEEGPTDTGSEHLADRIRRLVAHSDELVVPEIAEDNDQNQRGLKPIYIDDGGLVLTQGIVVPEQPTPIHSHGTWGIVGVYRGRDRYQIWRCNGYGAGPADLQLVQEVILEPGDAIMIPPPPQDIHLQQGYLQRGYAEEVHPRVTEVMIEHEVGQTTEDVLSEENELAGSFAVNSARPLLPAFQHNSKCGTSF